MRYALLLIFAAASCLHAADPAIDQGFNRLYNFDFAGAHRVIDPYIAKNPDDPLGYAVRASALLFEELDRLQILESEFFSSDKRITDKKKLKPDPVLRQRFMDAVAAVEAKATVQLQQDPQNANALFALSLAYGLTADYTSLVEKRQWASFRPVKQSTEYATRLLKSHPNFTDAYLTTGLTEYLVGSLPIFLRWFVKIDGVEGSKEQARVKLTRVSESGRYLKPFARILLSIFYLREKQPTESTKILASLSRDFPENPLFKRELTKIQSEIRTDSGSR